MNRLHRLLLITTVALALSFGVSSPAHAAAPANDEPVKAKAATGIGYSDSVNVSQATAGRGDPTDCFNSASVWYKYTPGTTETINVNTIGSNYETGIGVYTGRPGAFSKVVMCGAFDFKRRAALDLEVEAGTTYWFMVGVCCRNGRDGQDFGRLLQLQFHMTAPPRIDELAAADSGVVDRTDGEAHVTVSFRCDFVAGRTRVEASLRQRIGETFVARSSVFRRTSCGTSSSDLALTFRPKGEIAFGEGPAAVSLRLTACSPETGTCAQRRIAEEVLLAFP
jgi:hypothetical protein